MKELVFDSGVETYSLNGKCEVSFNPADRVFAEKFYNAFEELGKLQEEYGKRGAPEAPAAAFDIARERDEKMRQIIDDLFGAPVCVETFGSMSVCAFADGLPVWMNLMLVITDELMENLDDVEKKADPRVAKYTAKYKKFAAKYRK